jgi:hypothetical protein
VVYICIYNKFCSVNIHIFLGLTYWCSTLFRSVTVPWLMWSVHWCVWAMLLFLRPHEPTQPSLVIWVCWVQFYFTRCFKFWRNIRTPINTTPLSSLSVNRKYLFCHTMVACPVIASLLFWRIRPTVSSSWATLNKAGAALSKAGFPLCHSVQTGSEAAQPPVQWVHRVLAPMVKRPGRKADHLPPSRAEVKNAWSHTSTPK